MYATAALYLLYGLLIWVGFAAVLFAVWGFLHWWVGHREMKRQVHAFNVWMGFEK